MNRWHVLLVFVLLNCMMPVTVDAITCSDQSQSHPASAAEALNGVKVGDPVCPADAQGGITADAGAAKQQLNSMWCGGKPATCGPFTSSVQELDPKFAVCAAKFLTAVRQRDPAVCIQSAYRSTPHQACVCSTAKGPCATPGNSKHQFGIAIDISDGNNTLPSWVHQMAAQGSGVEFPVRNDDGHMQPVSGDTNCSTPGYNAPAGGQQAQTPTSGFAEMLRQYMGGGQQQATGAVPANNSIPASSQPFASTQSGTIAQPSTSGSAGSTGATTTGGTSQTTAVPATIATGNTAQPANVSDQLTTSQSSGSSNAYDLLNALANPTTTKTTSTGTPIVLNGSLYQSQQVTETQVQYDSNGQPIALNGSLSNVSALGPNGQQTFTSQDLQYTQSNSYVAPTNSSFAARTLESLKQALLKLLAVLQPFGYLRQTSAEATE